MKYLYSLILLTLMCNVYSQDLVHARRSSYRLLIYRLTNSQAEELYTNASSVNESYFRDFVTSYNADSVVTIDKFPVGHYMLVKAVDENLEIWLESKDNTAIQILNNKRDVVLIVSGIDGREIQPERVTINDDDIKFDNQVKAYRKKKANLQGLIKVEYKGHKTFYYLDRQLNKNIINRVSRSVGYSFPMRLLLSPFIYLERNISSLINYGHVDPPGLYYRVKKIFQEKPDKFQGYLVTNKPVYRPGDTVRIKAVAAKKNGKLFDKPLKLTLYSDGKPHKIGIVPATQNGSYLFDLLLADSLDLTLDRMVVLSLNYDYTTVVSGSFKYEDYELKSNKFDLTSDSHSTRPAILYLEGKDSNGMPLYDVHADLTVTTKPPKDMGVRELHLADTLWQHTVKLETSGRTKVILPDTLFPKADFDYTVDVVFLNRANERTTLSKGFSFEYDPFPIDVTLHVDSILLQSDKDPGDVHITVSNSTGITKSMDVHVPAKFTITPDVKEIAINYRDKIKTWLLNDLDPGISFEGVRTADSVKFSSQNKAGIVVRYFIFRNNRLIYSGEGSKIRYAERARWHADYSVSAHYIWGGEVHTKEYSLPISRNDLTITTVHPDRVYPGEKANITLDVSDSRGRPVPDVNLTAYAVTGKFPDENLPLLPDYNAPFHGRKIYNSFSKEAFSVELKKKMEWDIWSQRLGLDSMMYYDFLFPEHGLFTYELPAEKSEILPFVVDSVGQVLPVHFLFVDDQVIYSSMTIHQQPYVFAIDSGYHKLTIRSARFRLSMDSVYICPHRRIILSINKDNPPAHVTVEPAFSILTNEEVNAIKGNFIFARKTSQDPTIFSQENRLYPILNAPNSSGLMGPFYPGYLRIWQRDLRKHTLWYEPFFSYEYSRDLLKLREKYPSGVLKGYLSPVSINPVFSGQVWSEKNLEAYFNQLDLRRILSTNNKVPPNIQSGNTGRLVLFSEQRDDAWAYFIYNLNNPDDFYLLYNKNPLPYVFKKGQYSIAAIYSDSTYRKIDSVNIVASAWNAFKFNNKRLKADSFSISVFTKLMSQRLRGYNTNLDERRDLQNVRQKFLLREEQNNPYSDRVSGYVFDSEDGSPLIGVSVILKGTTYGTITGLDGHYTINAPANGVLVFSFVGMVTEEIEINGNAIRSMNMKADVTQLSEVMVVGYGFSKRYDMTNSISTVLQGQATGVQVTGAPGMQEEISIRGLSSLAGSSNMLIILDGKIASQDALKNRNIQSFDILKPVEATALYGARGAAGVIILSTKMNISSQTLREEVRDLLVVKIPFQSVGNSSRHSFRDYAFWQPDLISDKNGKAHFKVKFPDDITGWHMHVLGLGRKQSGNSESTIQSYKPLTGQLFLPRFFVEGDSVLVKGRITNYSPDSITLSQGFNGRMKEIHMGDSYVNSLWISTGTKDSMKLNYSIKYQQYEDEEERILPVYPRGTKETTGRFMQLKSDTSFIVDRLATDWSIAVNNDLLQVILDEAIYLSGYVHNCNEQMASRLTGLLTERQIGIYLDNKSDYKNKEIKKLIRRLSSNQQNNGAWSWWGDKGDTHPWITLHILRTLFRARQQGFLVASDKSASINYLKSKLSIMPASTLFYSIEWMLQQNVKIITDSLPDLSGRHDTLFSELVWKQRFRQLQGLPVEWKKIDQYKHLTLYGNVYFGDSDSNGLVSNDLQSTLMVYHLLEQKNPKHKDLAKIQGYLMEKRGEHWLNTYESASILATIVPGLIKKDDTFRELSLKVNGRKISQFPYTFNPDTDSILIEKEGSGTVYMASMESHWNGDPKPVDSLFKVTTQFPQSKDSLSAGDRVILQVQVEAEKRGEYLMMSVPVPAGTSYADKNEPMGRHVVHREYFRDHVNLYFETLPEGKFEYKIVLIPRYSGYYTLNPARMESMYFPLSFGRNATRRVVITE